MRVPYYRELFARKGIDPARWRHLDDLREIPELTKGDVIAAGTPGGVRCLDGQEPPTPFQAFRCAFGDDYLWHSGTALSSSVPQVFNQARTSWPVRWRPVSL